jgi:hypothetical protein
MNDAKGWYMYALVRTAPPADAHTDDADTIGAGVGVELIRYRDIAAAVSEVRLADMEIPDDDVAEGSRLALLARRHDEVIRELFDKTTTLPLQLATVVKDKDDVDAILANRYEDIAHALDQLAGGVEWGVRISRCAGSAPPERPEPALGKSGTAYLAGRKAALQAADERRRVQADLVREVVSGLAAYAWEIVETSRGGADTMMDVACLVDAKMTETFLDAAAEQTEILARSNAELTVTGPWPPYTFAREKLSMGGRDD